MTEPVQENGPAAAAAKPPPGGETFARYLARYYAGKGYSPGTVPEAKALQEACDYVLTLADGFRFAIVCLVDREARPGAEFGLGPMAVRKIGQECVKYSGTMNKKKMPITIRIVEAGEFADLPAAQDRLRIFKRKSIYEKAVVSAWTIDVRSKAIWSNAPFGGRLGGAGEFKRLLGEPRKSAEALQPAQVQAPVRGGTPWLTWAMLCVLVAVFAIEQIFQLGPRGSGIFGPGLLTLDALGGLDHGAVLHRGQWFRLFSSALLHGDLIHLVFNGAALLMVGYVLETMIGRAWYFAAFVIGAIGGSLMSLAINPASLVSVGASGAIMGLFATAYVCSFRVPDGPLRMSMQVTLLRVLVPSLLPLFSMAGHKIDYAGHFGGALAGTALGAILLKAWRHDQAEPPLRNVAAALSVAGLAAFAGAFVPVYAHYDESRLALLLIPHDPRSHYLRALALIDSHDLGAAETEMRAALQELDHMRPLFKPQLGEEMNRVLAWVVAAEKPGAGTAGGATDAPQSK